MVHFNEYLAYRRRGMPTWLSVFPDELAEKAKCSTEGVVLNNMGGNTGH
jgi:hypothetical protein